MNYRHHYHAGNFADVFKHALLITLIQSLLKKDTGFCYLETHAGTGFYHVGAAPRGRPSQEYLDGIAPILTQSNPPEIIQTYLNIVRRAHPDVPNLTPELLAYYPGSPMIAQTFLRPQDRMILSEQHSEDGELLKYLFHTTRNVTVLQADGYQSLKACLPPREKRGLVFIDPSYEQPNEWQRIITGLQEATQRWQNGIYAIWYPIKDRAIVNRFHRLLKQQNFEKLLWAELSIYPEDTALRLNGCGLVVINPPWKFASQCDSLLPWLWQALSPQQQGQHGVTQS